MPDSTPRHTLELISTKTSVDNGQLLTDDQLETAIQGFEEGGYKEAKHAAGILSRGKMTEEVWGATHEHLFDLIEQASAAGVLDENLPRAACTAARVVAQTNSETSIDPPVRTELGESLIRDGTSDVGDPWLTAAGTLLLSAAIDAADYDPSDEIAKRIAEHLLTLSKKTDGSQEANLAAAGYGVLGRASGGDHARTLVAESIDLHQYLLRTEPNLREGFLRFAARLANDDPTRLEPYTVELATHLRADAFPVRRDAARAFAALSGEIDWESLQPGVHTLDGAFENDGPMFPLFAVRFLHQVADHDPEIVSERVGDAFTAAVRSDDRFTTRYGHAAAAESGVVSRVILSTTLESLAPRFPTLVDAAGDGVFDELLNRDDEDTQLFVAALGGCFAAVDPDAVGEEFLQYLGDGISQGEQDTPLDSLSDPDRAIGPAVDRFLTRMREFDAERALSTADRLVTLADATETSDRLQVVGALLLLANRKRDDDDLATNFQSVIDRVTSDLDGDRDDRVEDLLEDGTDDSTTQSEEE
jgi:hypothetical protein